MLRYNEFIDYLAGLVLGDGDLYYRRSKNEYRIRISDSSREFLEMISIFVEKLLGINVRIYRHSKYKCFILVIYNKELYHRIVKRIEKNLREPTIAFIRGLFDAEGGVNKSVNKVIRIHFTNKDRRIINIVSKTLEELGVKHYITKAGNNKYKIFICNKRNTLKFLYLVKTLHPKITLKYLNLVSSTISLENPKRSADRVTAP